jgi:phosphatidylglycerol:prolipoprotein diacylglycerol transferase
MSIRSQKKTRRRHTRLRAKATGGIKTARAGAAAALGPTPGAGLRSTALAQAGPATVVGGAIEQAPAAGQLGRRQPGGSGCAAAVSEAGPHALAATYWMHARTSGSPQSVTIRFVGTRVGLTGTPGPGDRFERFERVDGIATGCGRVAITTRISGVNQGRWRIAATPVRPGTIGCPTATRGAMVETRSRHWDLSAHTRLAALAYGPGVRVWAWPALVGLGVVMALVIQAMLLGRAHVNVAAVAAISVGASLVGFPCARLWYLVQNRKPLRDFRQPAGACIQGFLAGGLGALAIAVAVSGLPLAAILDASTPGLFLGMAVGRPGCWLTGCCAGRPTASRWGLWSSDRRVGIRRVPIQLLEAALALLIGIATLTLVLTTRAPAAGAIFLGAFATYTLGRQALFPFRVQPRATRLGRHVITTASALTLLADLVLSIPA